MEEVESLVNEIIQEQIHTDSLEKGIDYGGAENPLEEKSRAGTTFSICQYE